MIFSKEILFLHLPKAAGSAVTDYLLRNLAPPMYYTHPAADAGREATGAVRLPGIVHETLEEAAPITRRFGFDLADFPAILVIVRNPYELEVSRYAYLRGCDPLAMGYNQALALAVDFEEFAVESMNHGGLNAAVERYFSIAGKTPPNLRLLRTETLGTEFPRLMAELEIGDGSGLERVNVSKHLPHATYYTAEAEQAVYERYRSLFDLGLYERMSSSDLGSAQAAVAPHRIGVGEVTVDPSGGEMPAWREAAIALYHQVSSAPPDIVAGLVSIVTDRYLTPPARAGAFRAFEARKFHVTPVSDESPIPAVHSLPAGLWDDPPRAGPIDFKVEAQLELLGKVASLYGSESRVLLDASRGGVEPSAPFGGMDVITNYCAIRHLKPSRIVEVGTTGQETFSAASAVEGTADRHVVIAPRPEGGDLRRRFDESVTYLRGPTAELMREEAAKLEADDVLLVNSSHVLKCDSDVVALFRDVLSHIRRGVAVRLFPIYLPYEYPRTLLEDRLQFWTEQYVLEAFLAFNDAFEVMLANHLLGKTRRKDLVALFPASPWWGGASFWLRRTDAGSSVG